MTDLYTCTQCDRPLDDKEPEYRPETAEDGSERIFRSVPELCPACREKRLWKRVERLKEGKE